MANGTELSIMVRISKQSTIVIQPQFDYAYSFSEGLAPVKIGDQYGYIRRP
jgi:WG containing repeat